jgi:2-polyprenyl-6-methoxyphenol hydroxylase-like FAD-dependent oxidoreductase
MRNATLINNEARATGNYSYEATRMRGDRYIMVGDAYAFVDPIFSSGVLLGMNSGVLGAEAVDAWLRGDPGAESRFRHFERMVDQGVKTFSWFIWRFNSPGIRDIGARSRFWLFKFFYMMFSLKHARESFRLWRLRVRNPHVTFTGGTTPVDAGPHS